MSYFAAIASGFRHYVNFKGRALRSQYWYWTLFVIVVSIVAQLIDGALNDTEFGQVGVISIIAGLGLFLPGLSVAIRRLHDTNRRGWWILLGLIPIIGWIILIIWYVSRGTEGDNNYGPPIYS